MTTDELPRVTGDAQFRLMNKSMNIVHCKNESQEAGGAFSYMQSAGSKWQMSLAGGADVARNTDVLHMEFGGDTAHNNMPLSVAAYVWHRTA